MGQIPRSTGRILVRIAMRYNKTDRDCCYRSRLEIVSPQFGKYYPPPLASGNISQTSGKQFAIVTSTPVTISIIAQPSRQSRRRGSWSVVQKLGALIPYIDGVKKTTWYSVLQTNLR